MLVRVVPGLFSPDLVVQVKALACELPATHGIPLSRWSTQDLVQQVQQSGLVASVSGSTLWRWPHEDAIGPWYHRSWVFPRDPEFAAKAGRVLDLHARQWQGKALRDDEFVISADEKTSIQARRRKHATQACRPPTPMRVEHEYFRCGAWTYIAALDVHLARVFGRCEPNNGIAPFDRLVEQVMTRPPYNDARRVFWIVDNGSVHRGARAVERLRTLYPRLKPVDRNLLLDCPAESSYTQRFRQSQRPCRTSPRISILLGSQSSALRMEDHSPRSCRAPGETRDAPLIPGENTLVYF
jgi:hypothetical protein